MEIPGDRKKALKTLMKTYWSSSGWVDVADQRVEASALKFAKRVGVMFDPVSVSHDDVVRRATRTVSAEAMR